MKQLRAGLISLLTITAVGCSHSPSIDIADAEMVTIENYKHENDKVTEVAQLMCFKRHLAPYQEASRSLLPAAHKIYVRAVDYSYANHSVIKRGEGIVISSTYLLLKADLQAGQQVAIKRQDEKGITYLWLQDLNTGKAISEIKAAKMLDNFNVNSQIYDRQCAKGTV